MILTEKDLQLLSSLPAPVPEEKREMDLKIGEYWAYFILKKWIGYMYEQQCQNPNMSLPKQCVPLLHEILNSSKNLSLKKINEVSNLNLYFKAFSKQNSPT